MMVLCSGTSGLEIGGLHHDGAARQALADIVVGVAEHFELHALHGEGAERLAGGAAQPHRDGVGLQARHAVLARDHGGEPRADGAMGVPHAVLQLHLLAGA